MEQTAQQLDVTELEHLTDEEIVELFTEYAKMKDKVDSLKRELTRLQ